MKAGVFKDFGVVLLQSKIQRFCQILQIKNLYCLVDFLIFLGFFASLKSSFFEFGKILPQPREFDHHFLPQGRELDKKKLPRWPGFARSKKFSRGLLGGMYPVGID